jgi:hypothetical protein
VPVSRAEPVEPAGPVAAVGPGVPVQPVAPEPAAGRSTTVRRIVPVVLVALVLAGVVGVLLFSPLLDTDSEEATPPPEGTSPVALAPDTSYLVSRVLPGGEVVVRQWLRSAEPVERLRLVLPQAPGTEGMSAIAVDVVADGRKGVGPASITGDEATYEFPPATQLRVRYRLTGALALSDSAPGRALALATNLDATYGTPLEGETRVISGPQVLNLACSPSADEPPVPCGQADSDGRWRVDLVGDRVTDRVMAQLSLE